MRESLERAVVLATRRPRWTVAIVFALALACGLLALGLRPSAGSSTFVSSSSGDYRATQVDYRQFGGQAVVVLIREPRGLPDLVETRDLGIVTELEACLDGEVAVASQRLGAFQPAPRGSRPPYGGSRSPCGKLMRYHPAQVVYGPGTFLNRAVVAVNQQISALESSAGAAVRAAERSAYQLALARHLTERQARSAASAAGQLEQQQQLEKLEQVALDTGISDTPSISDPQFIPEIVFDQTRGVNVPKARFSYLFPTKDAAVIQVRLRAGLSYAQTSRAIAWIRQAVRMRMFHLGYGGSYLVSGEPVVVDELASSITGSVMVLLLGALGVMALVLLAIFRDRLRLLPLAIALVACALTFGVMALAGATLTMASIAVLPVLIGLSVDYAIQFQSRVREAAAPANLAVLGAARTGAPTIAAAALATATGFLVLLLSPVPMVQGFGILLVIGIAFAFVCALSAGSAAIVLADGGARRRSAPAGAPHQAVNRATGWLGSSVRGAREILGSVRVPRLSAPAPFSRSAPTALASLARRPHRILAVGLVLAIAGWVADSQMGVQSNLTKLVPSSMRGLHDLNTLERVTGVSGEIDVLVHSRDVASAGTVGWMIRYEDRLLAHFGYSEAKGCRRATLCPALSLPDLFSGQTSSSGGPALTTSSIRSLLAAVPAYFSQAVITGNRRYASLAFGIRLMPLSRQQRVVEYMRSKLHPPLGTSAELAGLPVLAADANGSLSSAGRRLLMLLAGLLAVGLVLMAILRSPRRALVPLVPIVLATGWSGIVLYLIGIPLNPMSASLAALVIAISTEFSVLLSERFVQERSRGRDYSHALERAYRSTGAAVLASGVTAIAGFGVLILSNITMLRDFGVVTVIDMSVSLLGVLLVLPAVLALAERSPSPAQSLSGWLPGSVLPAPLRRRRTSAA